MDQKIKNLQDMALSISRQGRQQAKKDDKERNPSLNLQNPYKQYEVVFIILSTTVQICFGRNIAIDNMITCNASEQYEIPTNWSLEYETKSFICK